VNQTAIAFVIPWFGFDIPGGAESACREFALHLTRRGHRVEVLTTCARQFDSDWNHDYHRPGLTFEKGIGIRRFPVTKGDHFAFNALNRRLLAGGDLDAAEQEMFIRNIINSDSLCEFVALHRDEYYFILTPYMFGTTYFASRAAGARAIHLPCLHDEPYARLAYVREMLERGPALLFNSEPESRLAEHLFDLSGTSRIVLGEGIELGGVASERAPEKVPFLLYAGRKDSGKNVPLLLHYFSHFKKRHPSDLRLVLIGAGDPIEQEDCVDLGFVSVPSKLALLRDAVCVCQPSLNESFSKVIMEAWLMETPVLVHDACDVTKHHVVRSRGGLYFQDYFDFEVGLEYLLEHPEQRRQMGCDGKAYVESNYLWTTVLDRFEDWFARHTGGMKT